MLQLGLELGIGTGNGYFTPFFILKSDKFISLAFIAWSDKATWQKGLISACVQLRHFVTTSDWGSALAGRAALSAASGLRPDGLTDCVDRLSIIIALLT